jgi:uncharacterized BrkB/YihY/UPF0761 family membrane protein
MGERVRLYNDAGLRAGIEARGPGAPMVKPVEEIPTASTQEPGAPGERGRIRAFQEYAQRAAARAHAEREHHSSVDVVFCAADRDGDIGGGILAGALAYRLFIWLLPFALVLIALVGIAARASSESPRQAARAVGIAGLVSHSVATSAGSPGRWYALLIGVPVLLWTTRSLLRALIVVHRLVWTDLRERTPKPTPVATLRLLVLLVALFAVLPLTRAVWSFGGDVVGALLDAVFYAALWLLVSIQLPHRQASWKELVPGALLFAVAALALGFATTIFLAPYASSKEGTYGALGLAAALLLGLYLMSRIVVASAVANAVLAERRRQ